jgi:haloalkane dehalogenase
VEFVETPAERFAGLRDHPFAPHFEVVDAAGLRMHYVDEGPRGVAPVVLLHGEPSWSYLYRAMVPIFAEAGHRVLAPDLVGFGRSSKPVARGDYSYARHCAWVRTWIERLELREITLFCQDWGSLVGLRLVGEMPERFARVAVGNGFLPEGGRPGGVLRGGAAFLAWRTFARFSPFFRASSIVQFGTSRRLDAEERRAYDAPFPDEPSKAGARVFPLLVPLTPRDPAVAPNRRAWQTLERFERPFLTVFSDGDPITRGLDRRLRERIPGARGQPHRTVAGGHFLQEDAGPEIARHMVAWMAGSST